LQKNVTCLSRELERSKTYHVAEGGKGQVRNVKGVGAHEIKNKKGLWGTGINSPEGGGHGMEKNIYKARIWGGELGREICGNGIWPNNVIDHKPIWEKTTNSETNLCW